MVITNITAKYNWLKNEELMYSLFCTGIAATLIFWPWFNSVICILLFVYWLLFSKKEFSVRSAKSKWMLLFCLLYIIVIIGTFYSADMKEASFRLQKKSAILLFPLIFGTLPDIGPVVFKRTLRAYGWSVFAGCFFCIMRGVYISFQEGTSAPLHGYDLIGLQQMSPAIMGLCCVIALLYFFNDIYEAKVKQGPFSGAALSILMAAFIFFFLFLLSNRNALIGAGGLFIFYCFKLIPKAVHRMIAMLSLAAIFAVTVLFNPSLHQQWKDMTDFSKQNSIALDQDKSLGRGWGGKALRFTIWKCSWDIIQQHWVAGVGTGDVQDSLQSAYEKRQFYFASRYNRYDAHNQYIQEMLAGGVIGLLVFLSCIFAPLVHCIKYRKNILYILFLLCFAFVCITESMLELNKGIVLYSFFNSMLFFKKF